MADGYEDGVITGDNQPAARDRDQGGKFVRQTAKPEPMFRERVMEGAPNEDLPPIKVTNDDDNEDLTETLPERVGAKDDVAETDDDEGDSSVEAADDGQKFEVVVDGETQEVSPQEALAGYIRTATFHKRMGELNNFHAGLQQNAAKLQEGWQLWDKARRDYEEDLANLIPPEVNWSQAYKNAAGNAAALSAIADQQESYRILYAKLAASQQARAAREAAAQEAANESLKNHAVNGFARFVAKYQKSLKDQAAVDKAVKSMQRTAEAEGFVEAEYSQIFDPRMLGILYKASKYDKMMANRPLAVIPGKGRTLAPGSATPLNGNASRKGLDEVMRRQASSGRLDDTAAVFEKMFPS